MMEIDLKELGYSQVNIKESQSGIYELEDGTILEVVINIKSSLMQNSSSIGLVDGQITSVFYTTVALRSSQNITQLQDMKYTTKQKGRLVAEINGFRLTISPFIIQIKRSNTRDINGNILYNATIHAKTNTDKL